MNDDLEQLPMLPCNAADEPHWVQSCIMAVGFPNTPDAVLEMAIKQSWMGHGPTDLDRLLHPELSSGSWWSAPRWISSGDIVFFYHTKRAKKQIARLLKEVGSPPSWRKLIPRSFSFLMGKQQRLIQILEHAAELAGAYSGTIFACGMVGGPAKHLPGVDDSHHFRGAVFAEMADVHAFGCPLRHDDFSDVVRIKRQGTITPLDRQEFDGLKERLSAHNELPAFLEEARLGDIGFRNVTKANWRSVSCAEHTCFIHEAQMRDYFLDFLLAELKDVGTPLLEECRCFRGGKSTGLADYCVMIHGSWVPVEAKLNVLTEKNLSVQLDQYIHVESFKPTKGNARGKEFHTQDSSICLVIDQAGVYLTVDGEFRECSLGAPLWKRTELQQVPVSHIRDYLRSR